MDSFEAYILGPLRLILNSELVSVFVLTQKLCITMARFLLISKICLIQKLSPKLNVNKLEKILTSLLKTEFQKVFYLKVVDQSYGDMSLICGGVTDSVFERMITDAVKDNPDAEILFKIHPDTLARNTESGFQKLIPEQVRIIDWPINPITMLEAVDEVYVATSQLGFEALMCSKKVHVYGLPFYAGWGLTDDKVPCPRRKRKLSIEELFYIVYLKYVHYFDPVHNQEGSIEDAIQYILQCRKKLLDQ